MTSNATSPTPSRLIDEYFVVAAQGGDRRAFAALIRRWRRRLSAHAFRLLGDEEVAQDAVQSAWVEISQGLTRLRDEAAFPAWAYRIVSRRCAREIQGWRARREIARAVLAEPPEPPCPPDDTAGDDSVRLHAAIRDLPPAQRAAIALYHFEDLSIAEIAVALDVPAGTVKTRLMHARRALRAALQGDRP